MEYEKSSCVRGYHVYGDIIWEVIVDEVLQCDRERSNPKKDGIIIAQDDGACVRSFFAART